LTETRAKLKISGRVQGVGFRYFVYRNAEKLGVKGYVKNTPEGDVEAVLEGEKSAVESMKALCRKGPRGAVVENIECEPEDFLGEFGGFGIKL
jgi:acylphosphatase